MKFLFPKKTSTPGSNRRRFWTLASIAICVSLTYEAFHPYLAAHSGLSYFVAWISVAWSMGFFVLVVAVIPFLTSHDFWPNPNRLAFDALVSIYQTILAFALLYRIIGIVGPDPHSSVTIADDIYFSAVTFSTLGYGDFHPSEGCRLIAALQSILGNLHLGMIVGVAFFAAQPHTSENSCQKNPPDDTH